MAAEKKDKEVFRKPDPNAPYDDTIWHYGFRATASPEQLQKGEEALREYKEFANEPFTVNLHLEGRSYLDGFVHCGPEPVPVRICLRRDTEQMGETVAKGSGDLPRDDLSYTERLEAEEEEQEEETVSDSYWAKKGRHYRRLFRYRIPHRFFESLFKAVYYPACWFNGLLSRRKGMPKDRPMRVMRLTSVITQGGVAKVCMQSFLRMPRDRIDNYLFVFGEKAWKTHPLAEKGEIKYFNRKLNIWPSSHQFSIFKSMLQLSKYVWRFKPDILHIHEPQFVPTIHIVAALTGGRKVVAHLHNDYNRRGTSVSKLFRPMTRHALRNSHLIACSRHIHAKGLEYLGQPEPEIALIEDGNDDLLDSKPNEELIAELKKVAGDRLIIAKMANIMPHKRIDDFLIACRVLIDRGHHIFPLLMCYGKRKNARRLRIRFNHLFSAEEGEFLYKVKDAQHILAHVDIGVTTSELEGLGLNVLEYQVEGVPVVCSDLDPHMEMVTDNETGLLYPVGDVKTLVEQLEFLLENPEERKRLGEAGRRQAAARKWQNTADQTLAFYERVLEAN